MVTNELKKEKFRRTLAQKYQEEGKYEVAKNMLFKLHLDIDTVQKATGITKEDLQRIIKK